MEDIPPTNDGSYWRKMDTVAKIRLHQGWLTQNLTLDLTCEDGVGSASSSSADFYYVRLTQRNGQRAWSSPIWLER